MQKRILHVPGSNRHVTILLARPYVVKKIRLSFAVPWQKFTTMVANMEESFLITGTWSELKKRIG